MKKINRNKEKELPSKRQNPEISPNPPEIPVKKQDEPGKIPPDIKPETIPPEIVPDKTHPEIKPQKNKKSRTNL